jgi:hypothetical protein
MGTHFMKLPTNGSCTDVASRDSATEDSRFLRRTCFSTHRSPSVSFRPLQQTLGIEHGDLRLVCSCSAMNSISRSSRRTVLLLTRQSSSVSLFGLPLHGWAFVAPRCFHLTITALTVDPGSSSRTYIWQTDLLESYGGAMLKVTELFSKAILLPMFVYGDYMTVCLIFYTCPESTNLKGCPHTFVYIVCLIWQFGLDMPHLSNYATYCKNLMNNCSHKKSLANYVWDIGFEWVPFWHQMWVWQ